MELQRCVCVAATQVCVVDDTAVELCQNTLLLLLHIMHQ